jgi:diguanylate cyclase
MVHRLAEQEEWRARYYDALRGFEQENRQVRDQLETLYKLVGRLCVAAQGQSPQLDAELKRLRDAVRKQAPGEQLEPMYEALADAVQKLEREAATPAPPPATARAQSTAATAHGAPASSHLPASPQLPAADIDQDSALIRAEMSRLLDEVAREPEFAADARAVEEELFSPMMGDHLPRMVEKVAALAIQRLARLEKARQETEGLLAQMMGQLDSLTSFIQGHGEDETARTSSSDTLNLQITGEMRAMGESVDMATDLAAMRRQLRARLDAISEHLQSFRTREEERARQTRERNEDMRMRMDEMESEARRLQARLTDQKRMSLLDPVTRIANRLAWDHRYAAERQRWRRFRQSTCVAAWDIDSFKSINDRFGHRAGDKVLSVVAESLSGSIRSTDFVARYGGEEFAMLLPGTSLEDAVKLAEKVRVTVEEIGFHFRGEPVTVTISCGVTEMRKDDEDDSAFERADAALYEAKNSGRNRVVSG